MKNIIDRLFSLQGERSRRSFAQTLGVAEGTLRGYESGSTSPNIQTLEKICEKLRISRRWLLLGEGHMREGETGTQAYSMPMLAPADELARGAPPEDWAKQAALANERLYQAWERERRMQKENSELKAETARQQERIAALEARLEEKQVMIDGFLELHKGGADCEIVGSAPPGVHLRSYPGSELNKEK